MAATLRLDSPQLTKKSLENTVENMEYPRLFVLSQGSVSSEFLSKNGISKHVHVVVKNLAFQIEVGSTVDLRRCSLDAKLLYDYDREEDPKLEVSYVKNEPMEYKVNIIDNGAKAIVEIRMKVLTSQHEDMLFRVRFTAHEPITATGFSVISQPIKVISKLTPFTKVKGEKESTQISTSQAAKKRGTSTDYVTNTINELSRQVQEQTRYLQMILAKLFIEPSQHQPTEGSQREDSSVNSVQQVLPTSQDYNQELQDSSISLQNSSIIRSPSSIEDAFRLFLSAYNSLSPEDKTQRLQSILVNVSNTEEMNEVLELFEQLPRKRQKTEQTK